MLVTNTKDADYRRDHVRSITGATTRSFTDTSLDKRIEVGDQTAIAAWGGITPTVDVMN